MARRPLLVGVVAAVVAAAAAVPLVLWLAPRAPDAASFRGSQPPVRITLPEFELRDHGGEPLRSSALGGRVAVVTFLETQCRQACPIIADQIREGARRLTPDERGRVAFLAVSTHPGDDTPASVGEFLRRHRVRGTLRYLVGTESELRPVWKAFQVLAAADSGNPDIHSAPVRIYDRDGVWVSTLHPGVDLSPDNLVHDIRAALTR